MSDLLEEDIEAVAWRNAHVDDLWVFDKLILSRKLGYCCGPAGLNVPYPGIYITRPCVNIPGMGKGASFEYIKSDTKHLPHGYFWCEVFKGRHLSIDYRNKIQVLAVEGFHTTDSLWRFEKWVKVNDFIPLPSIFAKLADDYEYINVEYVDGKIIECHFRSNPDFIYNNTVAYPVWNDQSQDDFKFAEDMGLRYVDSPEYYRKGFFID